MNYLCRFCFSFSRHRRILHGAKPYYTDTKQSAAVGNPPPNTTIVFVPMVVPNTFLGSDSYPLFNAPLAENEIPPLINEEDRAIAGFEKLIELMEIRQIENQIKELMGSLIINSKEQFQLYFDLALLALGKDESSEMRRREAIFQQLLTKFSIVTDDHYETPFF